MFEITGKDVELLDDFQLRTLLGKLCETECHGRGYSTNGVTWGGHQNAPDGGIDVRVALSEKQPIEGYVRRPQTGFQAKAENMAPAKIQKEMMRKGKLLPSISELAKLGGAYIIASSKDSCSDRYYKDRIKKMKKCVSGANGDSKFELEFYDQNRLASWVNEHPAIGVWLRKVIGKTLIGWQPFGDWSSKPKALDAEYLIDGELRVLGPGLSEDGVGAVEAIDKIRSQLQSPMGAIRIVGLSGVGKTRFVQALFDERLGNGALDPEKVIYADQSDSPNPVPLELTSNLIAKNHEAILIVDNCGSDLHVKLVAQINQENARICIITIEYDVTDDKPEGTQVYQLLPSSEALIQGIVERDYPQIGEVNARTISEVSGGNARIALALANTVKQGESLALLKDTQLFERLFEQKKGADKSLLKAAQAFSLLYSFDGETLDGEGAELPLFCDLAQSDAVMLYAHCAELMRRQLVQKRSRWRAVLPHALAHRLANTALENLPTSLIEDAFVNSDSERVLKSFSRRLGHDLECH